MSSPAGASSTARSGRKRATVTPHVRAPNRDDGESVLSSPGKSASRKAPKTSSCSHCSESAHCGDETVVSESADVQKFVAYHQVPTWAQDNEYITHGYRVNFGWRRSLRSICSLHNETMNVWTHLVGTLVVIVLLFVTMLTFSPHGADRVHRLKQTVVHGFEVCPNPSVAHQHTFERICDDPAFESLRQKHKSTPFPQGFTAKTIDAVSSEFVAVKQAVSNALPSLEQLTNSVASTSHQLKEMVQTGSSKVSESTRFAIDTSVDMIKNNLFAVKETMAGLCPTCTDKLSHLSTLRDSLMETLEHTGDSISEVPHSVFEATKHKWQLMTEKLQRVANGIWVLQLLSNSDPKAEVHAYLPLWPIAVFLVSAIVCQGLSATFHLFCAVSQQVSNVFQRLDYAGISILIGGSNVPLIYYGFYCEPQLQRNYLILCTSLCLLAFLLSLWERFNHRDYRVLRASVFLAVGFSGAVPFFHLVHHIGKWVDSMTYVAAMGALYVCGATLYATRVPERCRPGRFNTCGASHQIFHVCVFAAVITLYIGLVHFYEWRIITPCASMIR